MLNHFWYLWLSSWVAMVFLCFSGAFWSSNLCFKGACKKACCIEIDMETNHQDANIMISGKEGRAIAIQGIPGPIRTWAQHLTSSFLPGSSWNLIVIPVSATFLTSELIPWKGFHILRKIIGHFFVILQSCWKDILCMQNLSPMYLQPRPSRPVTMFAGASAGRSTRRGDPHAPNAKR